MDRSPGAFLEGFEDQPEDGYDDDDWDNDTQHSPQLLRRYTFLVGVENTRPDLWKRI